MTEKDHKPVLPGRSLVERLRRGLPAATLVLVAAAVLGALVLTFVTRASLTEIGQGLPLAALQQQDDAAALSQDLTALRQALEALGRTPAPETLRAARQAREAASRRLFLIAEGGGPAARPLDEGVGPALQDLEGWLDAGAEGAAPQSTAVAELALGRLAEAEGAVDAFSRQINAEALAQARAEAERLTGFRALMVWVFGFGALLILIILFLVLRQHWSEAKRRAAERQLGRSIELISGGFALFDARGRLVLSNEDYARLFPGAEAAVVPGASYETLLRAAAASGELLDATGREELWVTERLAQFQVPQGPVELRFAGGRWVQVAERKSEEGGLVVLTTDITEMRRREGELRAIGQDLRDDNLLLDAALDHMSQGLAMFDVDHCLVICNRRYLELFELPAELGRPGTPLKRLLEASARRQGLVGEAARQLVEQRLGVAAERRERHYRSFLTNGQVVEIFHRPLPSGGSLATYEDVTESYRAEAKLRAAKDEAEVASRAKSDFLANVSHELRTPLNAILGFSEMMKEEMYGPHGDRRYREYAFDIHESGHLLLSLINDILDLSKIEAGRLELREENLVVADTIEAALHLVQQRAEAAGVEPTSRIAPGLPRLYADARVMTQILLNLLTNAIKFTREGGKITVGAELAASGGLLIYVEDSGIGMSEEEQEKALTPFGQVDSAHGRKQEGTGLGLPLSKHLVELHGGHFRVASKPGEGTRVEALLPAERLRLSEPCQPARPEPEDDEPEGDEPEGGGPKRDETGEAIDEASE